jgi:hypothetical protein
MEWILRIGGIKVLVKQKLPGVCPHENLDSSETIS